jgi:hypothetical protein
LDLRLILASHGKRRVVDIHVLGDRQIRHLDLFVLGFLLEAAVFPASSADDRPLVLSVVSPDYVRASEGFESLESGEELLPDMLGFKECAELYLSMLRERTRTGLCAGFP